MKHTFALLSLLSIVACSSSEPEVPAVVDPYPTTDAFCAALAKAECVGAAGNCGVKVDACETYRRQIVCLEGVAKAATASGKRAYASGNAPTCIAQSTELWKKGAITNAEWEIVKDACGRVFGGMVEINKPCDTKFDCKDQTLVCDKGFCAKRIDKKIGEGCADPGAICERTASCTGTPMMCAGRVLKGAGEECASGEECSDATPVCDPYKVPVVCRQSLIVGTEACRQFGGN